jgi:diadenylate cyclase
MFEGLRHYFAGRPPLHLLRDALDIFIVYYVVYRALLVLRGTRAMQVGVGLGMLFVLYLVAQALELVTVLSIMGALISSMILIIVVVFQSDIRRGLQRVGSRAFLGTLTRYQESRVIDEVVEAANELARHRIGALITFEQDANLDEFVGVHKGHVIDATVSSELLVSLFVPEGVNKLHDGSVVIRNFRIAKAGVFFPMPEGRVMDQSFGSRHRAALGITEETDAVVVIVSEERGTISFCFNGNIATNLDGAKLHAMLEAIFSPKVRKSARKVKGREASSDAPPSVRREVEGGSDTSGAHPRITLVGDDSPSRRLRGPSDPPPPLRVAPSTPPPPITLEAESAPESSPADSEPDPDEDSPRGAR